MRQIKDRTELDKALKAHFTRGVITNNFVSPEVFEREMQAGNLFFHQWDGGVIYMQKREFFNKLHFDIIDADIPLDIELPKVSVTEVIGRNNDEAGKKAARFFKEMGFKTHLERVRLTRKGNEKVDLGPWDGKVELATIDDCNEVLRSIKATFDNYAGCVPTSDELKRDIEAGNLLVAKKEGKLCGYLHIERKSKTSLEIGHIATLEHARGKKVAQKMMGTYINCFDAPIRRSWVGRENVASIELHMKNNFGLDGFSSEILILE